MEKECYVFEQSKSPLDPFRKIGIAINTLLLKEHKMEESSLLIIINKQLSQ